MFGLDAPVVLVSGRVAAWFLSDRGDPMGPSLSDRPMRPSPLEVTGWLVFGPRCPARRSAPTGRPCRGYAIHGGIVCAAHGGNAPQVRAAAYRRIIRDGITRGLIAGQAKATRSGDPLDAFDFRYGPRTHRRGRGRSTTKPTT